MYFAVKTYLNTANITRNHLTKFFENLFSPKPYLLVYRIKVCLVK